MLRAARPTFLNLNLNLNSLRLQQTSSKRRFPCSSSFSFFGSIWPVGHTCLYWEQSCCQFSVLRPSISFPFLFDSTFSLTPNKTAPNIKSDRLIFIPSVASPANAKLGLRMTTLHEEPSSRQTLTEEVDENYSDSELTQYLDDAAVKPPIRSKFPTSKTMGSLRDIGNNFQAMNNVRNHSNATAKNLRKNVINKHTSGTSSLTSSTSSGYGSQVKSFFAVTFFVRFSQRC